MGTSPKQTDPRLTGGEELTPAVSMRLDRGGHVTHHPSESAHPSAPSIHHPSEHTDVSLPQHHQSSSSTENLPYEAESDEQIRLKKLTHTTKTLSIFLLIIISYLSYDALTTLEPFQLRTLQIKGLSKVRARDLRAHLQLEKIRPSLLSPQLGAIEEAALQHAWIYKAQASFHFPKTIQLEVEEYKPAGVAILDEMTVVTEQGLPFAKISPAEIGDLPLISGIDPQMFNGSPKLALIGQYWISSAVRLAQDVKASGLTRSRRLSEVYISKTGRYELMLDQVRISLGSDMLKDRLVQLEKILGHLEKKGVTAAYILLSDDLNRAIVKEVPITAEDIER